MPHDFDRDLVAAIPALRSFAYKLGTREPEDLVQTGLCLALAHRDSYQPGTNLKAWLMTIMRNYYFSQRRRDWRSVPLSDGTAMRAVTPATQETAVILKQILGGLRSCRYEHRRAFELTTIEERSMEEAATIEGVAVGTIKSRLTRARRELIGEETL